MTFSAPWFDKAAGEWAIRERVGEHTSRPDGPRGDACDRVVDHHFPDREAARAWLVGEVERRSAAFLEAESRRRDAWRSVWH